MRSRIVSSVVPSLIVLLILAPSFAGVAEQFQQAEQLQKEGRFDEAEAIYKQVMASYPRTDYAFQAQKSLAILYVDWGKDDLADQSYKRLLADFPQHPDIAKAVTNIADAYRAKEKHNKALEIYQYVIAAWPKDEHALWSVMGSAISHACQRDPEAYDAALEKLCADFAGHKHLARAICIIADNWRRLSDFEKARGLYESALSNRPDPEFQLWSRMGLAISLVRLGETKAAEQTVDRLLADFARDERISVAACLTADEFRALGKHQKACQLYKFVVDKWPKSEHALWSQMGLAVSNTLLGQENAPQEAMARLRADFGRDNRVPIAACTIADEYRKAGKYGKACEVYQYVVTDWPGVELALWCQTGVAMCSLWLGNDTAAEAATDRLLAGFSTDERVAVAACLLADEYRKMERHGQARELYKSVVDRWPDSEHAIWSQMGLVISNIRLGSEVAARAAVEDLAGEFSTNRNFAQAIGQITEEYRGLDKYQQANQIHQIVLDTLKSQPESTRTIWTCSTELICEIALGNDRSIDSRIDRLMADFANDPDLPVVMFNIADQYYNDALLAERLGVDPRATLCRQKAIALSERIITYLPQALPTTPQAYHLAGMCYERLGQCAKAIDYYEKVVATWPNYQYAWHLQFLAAKSYNRLAQDGGVSESGADSAIKAGLEQLLRVYPGCPAAPSARDWLEDMNGGGNAPKGDQK